MDRNQRIAYLLTVALIVCNQRPSSMSAQDSQTSARPGVNAPKAISNGFPQQPQTTVPYDSQASRHGADRFNGAPYSTPDAQPSVPDSGDVQTPLKRRLNSDSEGEVDASLSANGNSTAGAVLTTVVVLLLFALGLAKLFLKRSPYAIGGLPTEAIDVVGRRVIDPRNSVFMIKVGSRMILLGSSPGGLSSLAEITDPIEVASLANICAASQRSAPDAVKWLGKLWPGRTTVVETRPFDDQLGERLFDEAQRGESARVDSLTVDIGRERHRAG